LNAFLDEYDIEPIIDPRVGRLVKLNNSEIVMVKHNGKDYGCPEELEDGEICARAIKTIQGMKRHISSHRSISTFFYLNCSLGVLDISHVTRHHPACVQSSLQISAMKSGTVTREDVCDLAKAALNGEDTTDLGFSDETAQVLRKLYPKFFNVAPTEFINLLQEQIGQGSSVAYVHVELLEREITAGNFQLQIRRVGSTNNPAATRFSKQDSDDRKYVKGSSNDLREQKLLVKEDGFKHSRVILLYGLSKTFKFDVEDVIKKLIDVISPAEKVWNQFAILKGKVSSTTKD